MGLMKNQSPKNRRILMIFVMFITALLIGYMWVYLTSRVYLVVSAMILGKALTSDIITQLLNTPLVLFIMSLYYILVIVTVFFFWERFDERDIGEVGIRWSEKRPGELAKGMLMGLVTIALLLVAGFATGALTYGGSSFAQYGTGTVIKTLVFGILTFAVVASGEEVLYRGYIQRNLMDALDSGSAIFFASAMYVLAQIAVCNNMFDYINTFLFAGILGYAYFASGSLYMPIGFHFIWRLFTVAVFNIKSAVGVQGVSLFILKNQGEFFIGKTRLGSKLEIVTFFVELVILGIIYFTTKKPEENASQKNKRNKSKK